MSDWFSSWIVGSKDPLGLTKDRFHGPLTFLCVIEKKGGINGKIETVPQKLLR